MTREYTLTAAQAVEWQDAAMYLAQRGYRGVQGDPLPALISADVAQAIADDPEAFEAEVRLAAYAHAMRETPDE